MNLLLIQLLTTFFPHRMIFKWGRSFLLSTKTQPTAHTWCLGKIHFDCVYLLIRLLKNTLRALNIYYIIRIRVYLPVRLQLNKERVTEIITMHLEVSNNQQTEWVIKFNSNSRKGRVPVMLQVMQITVATIHDSCKWMMPLSKKELPTNRFTYLYKLLFLQIFRIRYRTKIREG